jgi:hypothetical protein
VFWLHAVQNNSVLCIIAWSRESASWCIAWSRDSAQWCIAGNHNSAQWCIGSAELKKSFVCNSATRCEIQVKNFLVDSALCNIAWSPLPATHHCTESRVWTMHHCVESWLRVCIMVSSDIVQWCTARSHLYFGISLQIRNLLQKLKSLLISDPSGIDWWKNQGSKISWDCIFKLLLFITIKW